MKTEVDDEDDPMGINEVSWDTMASNPSCVMEWSRTDYGTSRLMLPGKREPLWSSRLRRVTIDVDTGRTIEDRSMKDITGRERRRQFKGEPRNMKTTFTYEAAGEVVPHQWKC